MGYWDKKNRYDEPAQEPETEAEDSLEALEADFAAGTDEIAQSFRERMKRENKRFTDMCDSEYWFCVCATSREQVQEFLDKIGIDSSKKYIDIKEMARAYKKSIKTPDLEFAQISKTPKEYLELSRDYKE